jgi:predicted PolB exonuclease-like 3'-5' exonuclease
MAQQTVALPHSDSGLSVSRQRAVIFDLETVPDLSAGRELLRASSEIPDSQVRRMLGERYARAGEDPDNAFVKISLQRIVCIGAINVERIDRGPWTVVRSGVAHVGLLPERELVERFVDSLAEAPSPQLVGFNSSSFDLPVLRYRAFALAVPAQTIHGGNGKDYWYRYGWDHFDICDVMSNFGASARPSLAELAALSGTPAKFGGIDGSQVESMVVSGRLEEIAAYCDTDIFVTYLFFLRFLLISGALNPEGYVSSLEQLRQHIADRLEKRPHLHAYVDALETMITSVRQAKLPA